MFVRLTSVEIHMDYITKGSVLVNTEQIRYIEPINDDTYWVFFGDSTAKGAVVSIDGVSYQKLIKYLEIV